MDWSSVLTTAITTAAVGIMMGLLMRAARKPPEVVGEAIQLRYPKMLRVFMTVVGGVFAAAASAMLLAALLGEGDEELFQLAWVCVPMFGLLGLVTLFEVRVNLSADGEGIRGRTSFRGYREVRWDELLSVSYSGSLNAFKLVDREGHCVRMSRFLVGHELIVELMRVKLSDRVIGKAIDQYRGAVRTNL